MKSPKIKHFDPQTKYLFSVALIDALMVSAAFISRQHSVYLNKQHFQAY